MRGVRGECEGVSEGREESECICSLGIVTK